MRGIPTSPSFQSCRWCSPFLGTQIPYCDLLPREPSHLLEMLAGNLCYSIPFLAFWRKVILLVVLQVGTQWRLINYIVITVMFIYLCDWVAHAATQSRITFVVDAAPARALPLPVPVTAPAPIPDERNTDSDNQASMYNIKNDAVNPLLEHETPSRPIRWVVRLVDGTPPQKGLPPGLKNRKSCIFERLMVIEHVMAIPLRLNRVAPVDIQNSK